MLPSRRRFIQKSLLSLPAVGALSACGGGGGSASVQNAGGIPTAGLSPVPVVAGVDLSAGLQNYGLKRMPYSKLAKPAKGQTVLDPDFGTRITRITDCVSDFKNLCAAPAYPTAMAWNSDETRFILYVPGSTMQSGGQQGWAMYNGTTYAFIKFIDINPGDVEQFYWDHQDPATLYYIDNHSVGSTMHADLTAINVETGVKTVEYSFLDNLPAGWPRTGPVRCGYPFALGINAKGERIWGLGAGGIPNINGQLALNVFGFNQTTKQMVFYDTQYVAQGQARGTTPFPLLSGQGWVAPDPASQNSQTGRVFILDINGKYVRTVNFDAYEHCDTAMNAAGHDMLVGSQFNRATGGNGNVIVADLNTGAIQNLVGESSSPVFGYPVTGSLTGSTAWQNPMWIATGMTGDIYGTDNSGPTANPTTLLDQEIMLTSLTSGLTYRFAHHRSTGNYSNAPQSNYWAQTNVTLSTSGTRVLFQSDWGNGDPSNPVLNPDAAVDTYVIELPSYKRA
ncbi:MAG: hypothetical protein KGJ54_00530 [Betaproteobacteria bacterium]|nr:hypothetical protein [Betaproteobacteria bacterium]